MRLRTLEQLKFVRGKRVLVRVDFNVAVRGGLVAPEDLGRIRAGLATIEWLRKRGARVVLLTHLGRPEGHRVAALRTKPIAAALRQHGVPVRHYAGVVGEGVARASQKLKNGEALLLENVRFHPGEEKNDPKFARGLAALAEVFVNDAFSMSHRLHASVAGVARLLPSYAGWQLEKEVAMLSRILERPRHPFVVIMGGAKLETKLPVIRSLLPRVDALLIGGALANTFFRARGFRTGRSFVEHDFLPAARRLVKNKKIILPVDLVTHSRVKGKTTVRVCAPRELRPTDVTVDIGPDTLRIFIRQIMRANTLVWNGPVGVCEIPMSAKGSHALGRAFAKRAAGEPFGVVGGGDTLPCLAELKGFGRLDFISTGGGAMLEYLSGKKLPGLRAITLPR